MNDERPIVAHQLSLLGDPPKPGLGWRPTLYTWSICGMPVPPSHDALRQYGMMRRETVTEHKFRPFPMPDHEMCADCGLGKDAECHGAGSPRGADPA